MDIAFDIGKYTGSDEIVDLAAAKKQLRIESADEDTEIAAFITAAVDQVEGYLGGPVYLRSGVVFSLPCFELRVTFPTAPINSITSIEYIKSGASSYTTLPSTEYKLFKFPEGHKVVFTEDTLSISTKKKSAEAVKITADVGYAAADFPNAIRQAVLLTISDFYEYRGDREKKLNRSVQNLLRPYRTY